MAVVLHQRSGAQVHLVRWAWVAVALTPFGWFLGIALAFAAGEGDAFGIVAVVLGALSAVLFVTAPALGVVLAAAAIRNGQQGRAALLVSGVLLLATVVLSALVGIVASIVSVVVLCLVVWRARTRPSAG